MLEGTVDGGFSWGWVIFIVLILWLFLGNGGFFGGRNDVIKESVDDNTKEILTSLNYESRIDAIKDLNGVERQNAHALVDMQRDLSAQIQAIGAKADVYAYQSVKDELMRANAREVALSSKIDSIQSENRLASLFGQELYGIKNQITALTPKPITQPNFIPFGGYPQIGQVDYTPGMF